MAATAAWERTTPLGLPVVPEVKSMRAGEVEAGKSGSAFVLVLVLVLVLVRVRVRVCVRVRVRVRVNGSVGGSGSVGRSVGGSGKGEVRRQGADDADACPDRSPMKLGIVVRKLRRGAGDESACHALNLASSLSHTQKNG